MPLSLPRSDSRSDQVVGGAVDARLLEGRLAVEGHPVRLHERNRVDLAVVGVVRAQVVADLTLCDRVVPLLREVLQLTGGGEALQHLAAPPLDDVAGLAGRQRRQHGLRVVGRRRQRDRVQRVAGGLGDLVAGLDEAVFPLRVVVVHRQRLDAALRRRVVAGSAAPRERGADQRGRRDGQERSGRSPRLEDFPFHILHLSVSYAGAELGGSTSLLFLHTSIQGSSRKFSGWIPSRRSRFGIVTKPHQRGSTSRPRTSRSGNDTSERAQRLLPFVTSAPRSRSRRRSETPQKPRGRGRLSAARRRAARRDGRHTLQDHRPDAAEAAVPVKGPRLPWSGRGQPPKVTGAMGATGATGETAGVGVGSCTTGRDRRRRGYGCGSGCGHRSRARCSTATGDRRRLVGRVQADLTQAVVGPSGLLRSLPRDLVFEDRSIQSVHTLGEFADRADAGLDFRFEKRICSLSSHVGVH